MKKKYVPDPEEDSGQERLRRRFSAGEMGEEGFEVRNEKTVGRLEPKPCFT